MGNLSKNFNIIAKEKLRLEQPKLFKFKKEFSNNNQKISLFFFTLLIFSFFTTNFPMPSSKVSLSIKPKKEP
ncbi:hypothetical protein JCM19296_3503 [Nonlabens ulvanivorans]|uniref:Uncharacterized protein n=1 Tax=Nonlabens ulvanivorans TaxID=906888 RepID=A0A081DG48_NONUL|nr:hypothetical protein JCM19296_3503 [Nonlabens ulvanivorans]